MVLVIPVVLVVVQIALVVLAVLVELEARGTRVFYR